MTVSDSGRRDPNIIWNCPSGDERELVLRLAEDGAPLRADAHHTEMDAFDLDRLVERIDVLAEQPIGGLPADDGDRAAVSTSMALISLPRSASKLEKLTYSPVTP